MEGVLRNLPRPVRTREGVFLLAAVLAGVGLALAIGGSPIAVAVVLFVASAALLTAGVFVEVIRFLSPRPSGTPDSAWDVRQPSRADHPIEQRAGQEFAQSRGARRDEG
jgi:hypothetical protein